jgi:hypothetical protein
MLHRGSKIKNASISLGFPAHERSRPRPMRFNLRSLLLLTLLLAAPFALAGDSREYTQFGHSIYIGPDQRTGDVTCFFCSVRVRGQVGGEITTFGGNVTIEDNASVGGDVTAFGGTVRLGPATRIGGELTVMGGTLIRDPKAQIGGDVTTFGGQGWLFVIFGLPVLIFAGIIALIVWLIQRRQRPAQTYARAA